MKQEYNPTQQIAKEDQFTEEIAAAKKQRDHLWVAVVAYKVTEQSLKNMHEEFINLDTENIRSISVGCFICEKEYSELIAKRNCTGESGAYLRRP